MSVRRDDVVLIDFPFSDRTGSKVRPALVVQHDAWNRALDDSVLAGITSSRRRQVGSPTQFLIETTTPAGRQAGLRTDSIVECTALVALDQARSSRRSAACRRPRWPPWTTA